MRIFFKKILIILSCFLITSCIHNYYVSPSSYDLSSPDLTIKTFISIIQSYSPSNLKQVGYFKSKEEADYFIKTIRNTNLPLLMNVNEALFAKNTIYPIGIKVLGSYPITDKEFIYLIFFNKPNLIYGTKPEILAFFTVKKVNNEWRIDFAVDYEAVKMHEKIRKKEKELIDLKFTLWKLKREYKRIKKMSLREIDLMRKRMYAKAYLLRNAEKTIKLSRRPQFKKQIEYFQRQSRIFYNMNLIDMKDYLLSQLKSKIELNENLLK